MSVSVRGNLRHFGRDKIKTKLHNMYKKFVKQSEFKKYIPAWLL